ncbi:unnamed protein product [Schistosoma intercalatum]|nr:unnamed protein product [Schistosoma intercalatum]
MTRTKRMKYNDDSSQDTDNSSAENIPSLSKVNPSIPLYLAFDIVKPNPKDSCSVGDNYVDTRYSVEEVVSREREVEKIKLEIRELQLRRRLLELTPNFSNKVRRPRKTTELSGSRSEDKTSVVTASHRYTNVPSSDEMQFKAQVDSVKALCMSVGLPKIEITKFDGSPLKFWTFLKGFKVNIADRVNDDTQKLMYLIHYCEGIAKDAIEHCVLLPEKEGYTEAIKILHERFGRPHDIVDTYALLDNGSDSTLLLSDVAKQVGISGTVTKLNISSVIGASSQNAELTNFEIESLDKTNRIKIEGAYTINNLPIKRAEIPPTDFQERWKHLKGVQLPTIACDKVGLLLGVDVPEAHWVLDQRIGKPKQPYASLTMLGWALFGPTGQPNKTSVFMNCLKAKNSFEEDILKLFEHEFSENKYSDKVTMPLCDKTIMEITDKQTVLLDGHYQVPIPWKVDWHSLPRNNSEIEKRLIYLRKTLLKDEQLRKQYTIILATHESKGYLSRVTQAIEEERYLIPHHPVFNPKKPGKVRIVFDCAAKLQNKSLNDCIYSEPDLTNDLVGVLLRFRKHKIGLSADIEEMFLQVHLPERDTKAFSFIWYPDGNLDSPPEVYEFHVHPFGATSSPFCATYALRRTATDHRDLFDEKTQSILRENFYVDDCLVSVETIPEAAELANNLIRLVALGGFRLHKWVSNVNEALNDVPIGDRSNNLVRIPGSTERIQKTLGLYWHTQFDCFAFDVNLPERPITKRGILSCASSLYDPLGFLAPLSLTPKRILQQLCRKNYGWDEMIDEESRLSWEGCLEAKSSIEDGPTPPSSLTTVAPENSSNRLLPFIDDPGLCLKHSPDVALLVDDDDDDVRSLIVAATAVKTEDSRVHQGLPSVRSSGFDTPPDSRSNRLIDTFDSVSKATDENLMDLEQVISSPAVDDEYLLKTVNDSHVDTVVNIDLRYISPPDKILPTDSGELMSSKTSVRFSAETDLPSVSDVNDSAKSVIVLHESSISCKATTQFSANTKLVSPVVASAESSIDIERETENQKDDCFIQFADDDKKFKTTVSMSPLVGLDKQIQHPLPDFKDSRVAEEMTHRNIEWHHNTPYANHHRVWERLIGSIRRPLSAVSMSYETLTTCLTEAGRIPNDRPLLQTQPKWTQGRQDLQVRDSVLIIEDTYARNNWSKGLVVSFDPGGDSLWNQAKIRTWKGTIIRGICKICLLEGADDRKVGDRETFQSDCG